MDIDYGHSSVMSGSLQRGRGVGERHGDEPAEDIDEGGDEDQDMDVPDAISLDERETTGAFIDEDRLQHAEIQQQQQQQQQQASKDSSISFDCKTLPTTPVTLITGFLGSGKTTLVNNVIKQRAATGKRVAVVLNEFGEALGIEQAMIQDGGMDGMKSNERLSVGISEWVELGNGCICCTVKSDFLQALEALADNNKHQMIFDHILLETSGLADPAPVINSLWADDEIEAKVKLDGVVVVVDACSLWSKVNVIK